MSTVHDATTPRRVRMSFAPALALSGCALVGLVLVRPAHAALEDVRGNLSIGYSKLFIADAPAGNLSGAGGLDYPVTGPLRVGLEVGLHLLGSRAVERGSLLANVDYSLFEVVAFAHWTPHGLGPIGRISVGPALMSARGELSTSGGGAAFSDLAVEEVAPGAALDVTVISRSASPVRVGLEVGGRYAFLDGDDWSIGSVRVTFHY
jgi:hypothetical protein